MTQHARTTSQPAGSHQGEPAGVTADGASGASPHTDHVVGALADFPDGSHQVVEVAGRHIGIFNIGGELHALPNVCPHQTGPVCAGRIVTGSLRSKKETGWRPEWVHDGEVIVCPWHGLEYHVPTGQCLAFPYIRLRRYQVLIEDDVVVVRMATPRRRR